jgi:hypothetical protein
MAGQKVQRRKVIVDIEVRGPVQGATRNEMPDDGKGRRREPERDRDFDRRVEKALRRITEKGART